jgi:NAD(P)-dependent dehydrogenase (short-subunit alcohol dehydrogenase family)
MAKNVLLVGGNSGIGFESAKLLTSTGWSVTAAVRDPGGLAGLGVATQPFDAGHVPELDLPEVLDGLVYCPGTINLKPFHRLTADDFQRDFQVNCLGAARVIQQALPALKKSGNASVVLFSTVAVGIGMPFHASIAAAKGAVEGLVRSLAAELAPGIRVNAIAPSLTDTPLAGTLLNSDAKRDAAAERHPLKRVGDPSETARAVTYLLSPDSSFMTGQVLALDGGMSSVKLF